MLNYRYIRFLLQKQLEEGLSAEEELFLQQWYQSLDTMPAEMPSAAEQSALKEQSWQHLSAIYEGTINTLSTPVSPAVVKRMPRWKRLAWPAAAALLLFAGVRLYFRETPKPGPANWVSLDCPAGKRLKMELPDHSVVWLNSGSSLQYNPDFGAQRQFNVRNGEVFFEVAKDAHHPFIVKTRSLAVKVLGTSFNVSAYTELLQEKVTVASGTIQVQDQHQCDVILGAGEEIVYNSSKAAFSTQQVNAARANSWRNGDIYLTNVSLAELAIKLENIYGYKVIFTNGQMKGCINSLHFNDQEPVTKVLDLLKIIDNITYTIRNKQIIISGKPC
ncbi:MAG: FecR domain-containing protein [Chitinophaga sp.]|uniref:FecR family protein n=1 Tax=Chitinophaga sp. TaxID=1869181 RepID=UPI001B2056CE|nr:FecR family protein [Chitinophaga sp.]MBO9733149.1 FecR domain-containing protein [Chitinophaga sp.]